MTTVWLQTLDVFAVLRWLAPVFLGRAVVRYDEHHARPAALRFLSLLGGTASGFSPAGLDFNRLDNEGHGLLYRMQDNLVASMGRYVEEALAGEPRWLRQSVHFRLRERLEWPLVFLTSAGHLARKMDGPHVFVIDADPADEPVIAHFASHGIRVQRAARWGRSLKTYLFPFRFAAAIVLAKLTHGRRAGNVTGGKPAIWSQLMAPATFDHAFWRTELKERESYELVYYLDRSGTQPSPETLGRVERQAFRWIDLRPLGLLRWAEIPWGRWLSLARSCRSRPRTPEWLKITVFESRAWREAFESVFTRFNVRLLIQHDDRGWKQPLQADALAAAGGIMLGYHWSNLPYAMKDWFSNAQHVYFVWGSAMREAIELKGHSCRHILPSGLWLTAGDTIQPEAVAVRSRCRFVLCLFDSDVSYDCWQSPATLAAFYRRVLALAGRLNDFGVLIKCKYEDFDRYESILPGGRELVAAVRALRAEGRLAVISPLLSPLTAARAADLSVCYAVNTAGLIVALRGGRAVHWDSVGLREPLIDSADAKIVYSDLGDLENAVARAASGDRSVGDLTPWARRFDRFQDERAAERVAGFIEDYMRLRALKGAFPAADEAAALYLARHHATDWVPTA